MLIRQHAFHDVCVDEEAPVPGHTTNTRPAAHVTRARRPYHASMPCLLTAFSPLSASSCIPRDDWRSLQQLQMLE